MHKKNQDVMQIIANAFASVTRTRESMVGLTASIWPFRLMVRTLPFHGKDVSSILTGATNLNT